MKREAAAKKKEAKSETRDDPEVKAETKEKKPITKACVHWSLIWFITKLYWFVLWFYSSTFPSTKTASAAAKAKRGQSNDLFSSWKAAPKKKTTDPVSEPNSVWPCPFHLIYLPVASTNIVPGCTKSKSGRRLVILTSKNQFSQMIIEIFRKLSLTCEFV